MCSSDLYDVEKLQIVASYDLDGVVGDQTFQDSFTSDLLYNETENELLVLDLANYRLVRLDCESKKIKASIPVGRLPFGLALSPDHKIAVVANVGMYAYPLIEGINEKNYNDRLIPHHPYAHQSQEALQGTTIEGKAIPGVEIGRAHV